MYAEEPTLRHGSQFLRMIRTVIPVCKPSALKDFVVGQKAASKIAILTGAKTTGWQDHADRSHAKHLTPACLPAGKGAENAKRVSKQGLEIGMSLREHFELRHRKYVYSV